MGTIEHPTDPFAESWSNIYLGNTPPAPLRTPNETEREMSLSEPQPPSRLEYPLQSDPGWLQEVAAEAGRSASIQDSIARWRDKVPKAWDLLNMGSDSTQENEVSNG